MNVAIRLALVLLLVSVAALAVAADPEPQTPTNAPSSTERAVAPGLDINQAEIEAGVVTEPVDAAKAFDGSEAVSPMMTEITAAMDLNRVAVDELAARAASTPDQAANVAIQHEIAVLKQQAELDVLGIQARYARTAGNEELANQLDAAIAAIISPPAPDAPTETRTAPGNQY